MNHTDTDGKRHAQRHAFALASQLQHCSAAKSKRIFGKADFSATTYEG